MEPALKKSWTATLENGNSPPSSVAIMPLIVLPNINAGQIVKEDSVYYSVDSSSVAPSSTAPSAMLPSAEEQILQVLSTQKEITRKEVQELLEVSQSTAGRILKTMVNRGQIIKLGGSLTTRYRAIR